MRVVAKASQTFGHPQNAGWEAATWDDGDHVHVVALNDLITHNETNDADCVCGPSVEPIKRDDGSIWWLWPIHSSGVAAVLVGPRAGVHYPGSTGGLQAWFRTDSDCVEPPSTRGYPPSLERPPAGRPSRASDQHYSC